MVWRSIVALFLVSTNPILRRLLENGAGTDVSRYRKL